MVTHTQQKIDRAKADRDKAEEKYTCAIELQLPPEEIARLKAIWHRCEDELARQRLLLNRALDYTPE